MRPRALIALLSAAILAPWPAAAQGWDSYSYPDAKFALQFPAQPQVSRSTYRTVAGLELPATAYGMRTRQAAFTLTVADFNGVALDQDAAIKDAVAAISQRGKVALDVEARINRQYGRELSVVGADGDRSVVAIFFFDQHLYLLDGRAFAPDADAASASLIHFQQSLQFIEP
jgi:hypothetical protein